MMRDPCGRRRSAPVARARDGRRAGRLRGPRPRDPEARRDRGAAQRVHEVPGERRGARRGPARAGGARGAARAVPRGPRARDRGVARTAWWRPGRPPTRSARAVARLLAAEVKPSPPTEAEIRAYYGQHENELVRPERVALRQILVAHAQRGTRRQAQARAGPQGVRQARAQHLQGSRGRGGRPHGRLRARPAARRARAAGLLAAGGRHQRARRVSPRLSCPAGRFPPGRAPPRLSRRRAPRFAIGSPASVVPRPSGRTWRASWPGRR